MKRAGNLLGAFFERNNIQDSQGYVDFFQSWRQIVGVDLAAHSDAVDIRNNALVVEVDHPGWMQKIHMQRERILKQVTQRYPDLGIRNIHFVLVEEGTIGAHEHRSPPQERATLQHTDSVELTPEAREQERVEAPKPSRTEKEALGKIGSERLRERLAALGDQVRQRDRDRRNED